MSGDTTATAPLTRQDLVRALPKAELHVHLEGTLEPETALACARRNGVPPRWGSADELRAAYTFDGLPGFLDVLFAVSGVMHRRADFYDVAMAYLARAAADGVRRAEIFFGAQTFLDAGVAMPEMMDGVLAALRDGRAQWGIDAALIATAQRHRSESAGLEVLDLAEPWRDQIIGVGLGSAERGNPPAKFAGFFAEARRRGYRLTIHAGEDGPASYVREALDVVRPDRIDHGVAVAGDRALAERVRDEGVALTMCPLSNLALQVVPSLARHPLADLLRSDVPVTVNSDDPPFFGGYVADNYLAAAEALDLSTAELVRLAGNSITASWAGDDDKRRLLAELRRRAPGAP